MHRRHRLTLPLLATPAVIGAMTVAMPALAGTSLLAGSPKAHAAATRCFTAIVRHHRVRECLLRGARGPRGFTGVPGPRGATGARGARGATGARGAIGLTGPAGPAGPAGANGTARAYAVVQPTSPTQANLISGQTAGITAVSEPSGGVYCVTPAAGINPAAETAAVSPEVSYSSGGAPGTIAVNAQRSHCPESAFEVDTYAPGSSTLTSAYAFAIVVP